MTDATGAPSTAATDNAVIAPSGATVISRPTARSEWTMLGVLAVCCVMSIVPTIFIGWNHWPETVADERIHSLRWIALAALLGLNLMVIAFATPWLGTVKVSGGGADLQIGGTAGQS